jgi:GT2 family glycosyltransferase
MKPEIRTPSPRLVVVIVNFRTPKMSIDCLRSLSGQVPEVTGARVVMVDNGSGDDSAERIQTAIEREGWASWVTLKPLPTNLGFAGGSNRGLEAFPDADYALLLNSDTLVHDDCLAHCLRVMDEEPDIGALSCKLLNPDGSAQTTARRFPTPLRQLVCSLGLPWRCPTLFGWADAEDAGWDRHTVKRDVDWLGGAFLMVRGGLLREIGGLDEDFFFYGEDVEFSHRIQRAGYRRHYDPGASITHFGAGSSDPARLAEQRRKSAYWRARYLVQRKCYGAWAAVLLRGVDWLCWSLRLGLLRLAARGTNERLLEAQETWRLLSRPLKT